MGPLITPVTSVKCGPIYKNYNVRGWAHQGNFPCGTDGPTVTKYLLLYREGGPIGGIAEWYGWAHGDYILTPVQRGWAHQNKSLNGTSGPMVTIYLLPYREGGPTGINHRMVRVGPR
jgi:hypothetical protein